MTIGKTQIGAAVTYVDQAGSQRPALVVNAIATPNNGPSGVNLVTVGSDPAKADVYGQKVEYAMSLLHKSVALAGTAYWVEPGA